MSSELPFQEFSFSARSLGASVASHSRQIVIAIHYAKLNTIGKIEVSYGFVRPARFENFFRGLLTLPVLRLKRMSLTAMKSWKAALRCELLSIAVLNGMSDPERFINLVLARFSEGDQAKR